MLLKKLSTPVMIPLTYVVINLSTGLITNEILKCSSSLKFAIAVTFDPYSVALCGVISNPTPPFIEVSSGVLTSRLNLVLKSNSIVFPDVVTSVLNALYIISADESFDNLRELFIQPFDE